jgi:PAS domain S-box-containing protein
MKDRDKTKEQLIRELDELRQRNSELNAAEIERRQVEQALRESEERYRSIVELAPDGILTVSLKGVATSCNSAFLKLTGFSRDEIVGKHISRFPTLRIEDIPKYIRVMLATARGKTIKPFEFIWVHKDGTSRWGEAHISLMKEGSKILGLQLILRDITERKQAAEALRESEERYRLIAENVTDVIWVADMDFRFTYVSPSIERLRGYSVGEVLAQSLADMLTPASLLRATEILQEERENIERGTVQPQTVESELTCKDGSTVEAETTVSAIYDENGVPTGILGITRDITERKRTEKQLQILSSTVEQSANSIVVIDREGNVEYANPKFFQLSELDPDRVLGEDWRSFVSAHSSLREALPKLQKAVLRNGTMWKGEAITRAADDEAMWREVTIFPIKDTKGEVTHAVYSSVDITERKRAEEELEKPYHRLEETLAELRATQERIVQQERLAAVGQLAAGIAHDFNNIMATVVLYAQMTARMEGLPAAVRQRMKTINEQAKHATDLIQQILDFSRRAVLERRPLDLAPLLKEHVRLLERTLPESIEIELECEPGIYVVNADPTRMQQMVTNLALNAREAMPQGGKLHLGLERIAVKPGESPLLPELTPGEWVRVTVSDTGTGIPPDALPHIFEPFFTTRAPLGSGLGLAQVHGIVGAHEGRIDVETQAGQGTTFTIYLPVHPSEPSPAPSRAELPALPVGRGETILVVEDNAVVRTALADSLELLNYRVLEVSNGQEALETLEERQGEVALVLSDVVMPRMSGTALLHALRERELAVQVVMLTGHPIEREMEELRAHGLTDWLPKPPQLQDLAQVLDRALRTA